MKNLHRLVAAILSLGMLGAAACSGCSQQPETSSTSTTQPMSYQCGAGTHRVGNQCVGNTVSSSSARPASTLNTSGNN